MDKKALIVCKIFIPIFLILTGFVNSSKAQTRVITGRVTNGKSESLSNVTVHLKGKNTVSTTNETGDYSITVPVSKATLIFRRVGFEVREIALDDNVLLNVELVEIIKELEDVVVVGYGTIKKSDYAGASSTFKMKPNNENRVVSVAEALQGKISGVQILNNSGEPGSGMTFNVRGSTSITGNNRPLIVVDGQPIESDLDATSAGNTNQATTIQPSDPLATINPNDIKSMEILKDASATAIYGSRGANGVVMITTKSGSAGKEQISFSTRVDMSSVPKKLKVLNVKDFLIFKDLAIQNDINDGLITNRPDFKPLTTQQLDSATATNNTNWQDLIFSNAVSHEHNLSISGGNGKSNFMFSGNYSDQNSVIRNAYYRKGSLRFNYFTELGSKMRIDFRTSYAPASRSYASQSNTSGDGGSSLVASAISLSPQKIPFEDNGDVDLLFTNNPQTIIEKVKDITAINNLISNMSLEYKFNKNFNYKLTGSYNLVRSEREQYWPRGTTQGDNLGGSALVANNENSNMQVDHVFSFLNTFKKHSVNAVAAYSFQEWNTRSFSVVNGGFPSDELLNYNLAAAQSPGVSSNSDRTRALSSILGRVNYAFNKVYNVTLTGRYDGSSRLANGNKWAFFPAIGLGWNIMNEKFIKLPESISLLKLRASAGLSGNENIGIGATQSLYNINYNAVGNTTQTGYSLASFNNPYLTWEKTLQYNLGLEIGLLNDRFSLSIDAYKKITTDLLINLSLPASSTFNDFNTNIGKVENKGIDIELNVNILKGKFKWDANANISFLDNKVISLGQSTKEIYGSSVISAGNALNQPVTIATIGNSMSSFLGYKTEGVFQNQAQVDSSADKGAKPGHIRYVDLNKDGKIDAEDRTIIGNAIPDYTFGFGSNLSYKGFSLSFTFLGSVGNSLLNLNQWYSGSLNSTTLNSNQFQEAFDNSWKGEGTSNKYPKPSSISTRFGTKLPDFLVEEASFLRLQNLNFGYTFNKLSALRLKSIRLYVSGTNLFTITKYSGYDPNINAFGSKPLMNGIDFGTIPQARTISLGLVVNY
ncbi:MAG: TonB-dependent receptor [Pseudarcicella sp.]|nr:TonB-dependent receptor [Pseudarcicella sp.]MBP6409672.1 TonB-dependent receptor [Pseudarcicella sp.]